MIRKFLVIDKQLRLSSIKSESLAETSRIIDLYIPLDVNWQMLSLLAQADYVYSNNQPEVANYYQKVFRLAAPYALFENDRVWLYKKFEK